MSNHENTMTVIGNCVEDPELRFTQGGIQVTGIRIAQTTRYMKNGEWQDGDTLFITGNAWRDFAENIAETLRKGDRTILIGRLRIRSYEDREGNDRYVTEIELDDCGPSCKFSAYQRKPKGSSSKNGSSGPAPGQSSPPPPNAEDVPF